MAKYFFTFGTDEEFPFYGGWVEIESGNEFMARRVFSAHYPNRDNGCLNCAFVYPEAQFKGTRMYAEGNFGVRCHARFSDGKWDDTGL